MNFTPKTDVGPVVRGILTIAAVGLIGWAIHLGPVSTPLAAIHSGAWVQDFSHNENALMGEEPAPGFQTAKPENYQLVAWYKSKHWWKRNAPIVGGAAGGALIGGLAGGGTGALIGGAAGGGGGYLYKRARRHHHKYYYR